MEQLPTAPQVSGVHAVRGAAAFAARYLLTTFGSIVTGVLLARWLLPAEFGVYSQVTFFVLGAAAILVADLGLGIALVRAPSEPTGEQWGAAASLTLLLGALAAVGSASAAAVFGAIGKHDVAVWIVLLGAALVVRLNRLVPGATLQRRQLFSRIAAAEATESLVYFALAVALVGAGFGVTGLVIAVTAKELLGGLLVWVLARPRVRPTRTLRPLRPFLRVGIPYQLSGALTSSLQAFQPVVIGGLLGASALGYVAWSYSLFLAPVLLVASVDRVLVATLARLQHDRAAFVARLEAAIRALAAVALPSAVVLFFCAHQVIVVVFHERWLPGETLVRLFAFSVAVVGFGMPAVNAFTATGATRVALWLSVAWVLLMWCVGPLVVAEWGMNAYGWLYLGVQLTYVVPVVLAVRRFGIAIGAFAAAPLGGAFGAAVAGALGPTDSTVAALAARIVLILAGFVVGYLALGGRRALADARLLAAAFGTIRGSRAARTQ